MTENTTANITPPRLSALLCVHNEAARLESCLEKLAFVDEIIVALDRCSDDSAAIAKKFNALVIEGAWPLEGPRRHAAIAAASGDWCLEIDADEWVTPELANAIQEVIRRPDAANWYLLPVDNYVAGKLVRHGWGGSFGTSAVARLWRRGCKSWGDQRVHPAVKLQGAGGGRLAGALIHHVDDNLSDMIARLNRYTSLRAQDLRDARLDEGLRRNIFRFFGRFYKSYWRRQGYREGQMGVMLALMAGLFPLLSYLKYRLDGE